MDSNQLDQSSHDENQLSLGTTFGENHIVGSLDPLTPVAGHPNEYDNDNQDDEQYYDDGHDVFNTSISMHTIPLPVTSLDVEETTYVVAEDENTFISSWHSGLGDVPRHQYFDYSYALPQSKESLLRDYLYKHSSDKACEYMLSCINMLDDGPNPTMDSFLTAMSAFSKAHDIFYGRVFGEEPRGMSRTTSTTSMDSPTKVLLTSEVINRSMSNVVEPVSPLHYSTSLLDGVQTRLSKWLGGVKSFFHKTEPAATMEDPLVDSVFEPVPYTRKDISRSAFFSFYNADIADKRSKLKKKREASGTKKEIGIETIPLLIWNKLEGMCILRLSKHLALVYLYTLLSEQSKVRELRKFWQSHNYTPWYQRHRKLYLRSQDHINKLISIETYVVKLCGQLHELMLTVEELEPVGRWIEGDGPLAEAVSQWGFNAVQWELNGSTPSLFTTPLHQHGACYSALYHAQTSTGSTTTQATLVESLACLHVLHRNSTDETKQCPIPNSMLRRHSTALLREEDRVTIVQELVKHEISAGRTQSTTPVNATIPEDEDPVELLPVEAYLCAFKYLKCGGGAHIPDEHVFCECTLPDFLENGLSNALSNPRFRLRKVLENNGALNVPNHVGIADLFSYTVVSAKNGQVVRCGDGNKMLEKELRAQVLRRCIDNLHFDELWKPAFEVNAQLEDEVAVYLHMPLSMVLAPQADTLLDFPKPSVISLSPLLSIVNLCRHWFPTFPVNMLHVINSRKTTPFVIYEQLPMYITHQAEHQVKFSQSIEEFRTPPFYSRHFELILGFFTFCGVSAYQAYRHQDVVEEAITDVKESAQEFYREHVDEPIRNISKRIFRAFFEKTKTNPDITRAEVFESRLELAKMLRNFGTQYADDISNSEKIPKDQFLLGLNTRAEKCDMSIVMHKYTADIQKPFTSAAQGSLLSGILIQVQKLKVDGEEAILDMDQIIEQNEINFNLAAAQPAVMMVFSLMYMANSVVDNIIRRGRSKGYLLRELRETLHKIESLLITGETKMHDENSQFDQNYLVQACTNTAGCTCPQMNVYQRNESRRRKPVSRLNNKAVSSRPGPTTPGLERHPSHIVVSRKSLRLDEAFDVHADGGAGSGVGGVGSNSGSGGDRGGLPVLSPTSPTPRSAAPCFDSPERFATVPDSCPVHGISGYVNILWRKENIKFDSNNQYDELYVNPFKQQLRLDKGEDRLSVRDDGYVLLYCTVMEELAQKLPKEMRRTVTEPLLRSISSLKSSEYGLHQKLMIVEHMYRAYDFFTYKL